IMTTSNPDGSTTQSTAVKGQLDSLGKVHGVWNQTLNVLGDSTGINVLRLQSAGGSAIITFNTVSKVPAHKAARGAIYYSRAQRLFAGTGAYAGATESGVVNLVTNRSRNQIVSLELKTAGTDSLSH